MWHFTHFIKPGAIRIGITNYSDELEATSFINPNGEIVTVLLNRTAHEIKVNVRLKDRMARLLIGPNEIGTAVLS